MLTLLSLLLATVHAHPLSLLQNSFSLTTPPPKRTWSDVFLAGRDISDLQVASTMPKPGTYTKDIVFSCKGNPNYWALTFDDGPVRATDELLVLLAKTNIKATFFVTGRQVRSYTSQLRRIDAAGHQIALHSWSHKAHTLQTNDEIIAEYVSSAKAIYRLIGKVPRYMRPPFGSMDARTTAVIRALGLVPIQWNRNSRDSMYNTPVSYRNITNIVKSWINSTNPEGVISLHHSSFYRWSEKALPDVLGAISRSAYKPALMSQCLSKQDDGGAYFRSGRFLSVITGRANL